MASEPLYAVLNTHFSDGVTAKGCRITEATGKYAAIVIAGELPIVRGGVCRGRKEIRKQAVSPESPQGQG